MSGMWAHPRDEMWARTSVSIVMPACFRYLTTSSRWAVFQHMTMVASRLSPAMGSAGPRSAGRIGPRAGARSRCFVSEEISLLRFEHYQGRGSAIVRNGLRR